MAWKALASGDSITLRPGYVYAVVASVKANHSREDVLALVAKKGLRVFDYAEQGERAGLGPDPKSPSYRAIALEAVATAGVTVPWSVPWPASMLDGSSILEAWEAPPGAALTLPAPSPSPAPASSPTAQPAPVDLRPLGVLAAGVGAWKAWEWWRGRRRRR